MEDLLLDSQEQRPPDPRELRAREELKNFFENNQDKVFYTRQIEVMHEKPYYHWVTARAVKNLINSGLIKSELRPLKNTDKIRLIWHKDNRYYTRKAKRIINLVEEYSDPEITYVVGERAELLVLEGFTRFGFNVRGRNTNKFEGKEWTETNHNIDFIFERDSITYGIEVKNSLSYIDEDEFKYKIRLCQHLNIHPVFVTRMLPQDWISKLHYTEGGFSLILKYQLYPLNCQSLVTRIREELELPVDTPKKLQDGTIERFINNYHNKLR